jgi:ATP-dependent 26S proteasome regulatory subunit
MIDLVQGRPEIALLGSCYRIDVVDQAVLRDKSRFNRKVFVHPPREEDRLDMLRLFASRFPMEEGVDLGNWSRKTAGFVGWDVENFCKKAALEAVAGGRERIAEKDLKSALGKVRAWLMPGMEDAYYKLFKDDCPHHYAF